MSGVDAERILGAEPRRHSREPGLEEPPSAALPVFMVIGTPASVPVPLDKFSSGLGVTVRVLRQARSHSFVSVERDVVPSRGTNLRIPCPSTHTSNPTIPPAGPGAWGPAAHGKGPEGHPVGTGLPSRARPRQLLK